MGPKGKKRIAMAEFFKRQLAGCARKSPGREDRGLGFLRIRGPGYFVGLLAGWAA